VLVGINICLFVYFFAMILGVLPEQHCTFVTTHPANSKLTAIALFQLVWHFLKLFGIFWYAIWQPSP